MKILIASLLLCGAALASDGRNYAPLPNAPAGYSIREVARMPDKPVKITTDAAGNTLFVLCVTGDVYRIDLPDSKPALILDRKSFTNNTDIPAGDSDWIFQGLCLDDRGLMYLVGNRGQMSARPWAMNHVTIFRGRPDDVKSIKPWFQTQIPFAIGVFQHGVSEIKQGPDGQMYVSSGSRTDHGESGSDPHLYPHGETTETACIWKLDPRAEKPTREIVARGLRNPFGFTFDDRGQMFATENGPNEDAPEEVNQIMPGKHYGFPYRFADLDHKVYDDQPAPPADQIFEPPLVTLQAHSSPSGIVYIDGKFLIARFGNLVKLDKDVGCDIVEMDPKTREVKPFLAPIARPTDLHLAATGKIYICEYNRQLANEGEEQPGRILELRKVDR